MRRNPRNKNHAVPTLYKGHKYASKLEARYAAHLDHLVTLGLVRSGWRPHPKRFRLVVNGVDVGAYTPDFVYVSADTGAEVYVDTKGRVTSEWAFREKVIRACLPDMDLRIVKSKDF